MYKKKKIIYLSTFQRKKNSGIFYKQFIQKIDFVKIKHIQIDLKIINPLHLLRIFKKLKKIIQKDDIIHSQYGSGCGLIGSFFNNKKIITLRGSDIENYGFLNDFYRFLVNKLTLFYVDKYDAIIVVSKRIKAKLIANKKKSFSFVLPDPVDHKKFFRTSRTKAKKILNLELSKRYIFFPIIDYKSKNKNFGFILKLKEKLQKLNIHILIANNKYDQKKMCLLYNACECTILASYTEGWPNVIKESIFCDTPVVSTDVSDLKILALKSKYIQISKIDVEEFYKRILFILKLRRPRNLKKIISFCDLNYYKNSLKSLYQKV